MKNKALTPATKKITQREINSSQTSFAQRITIHNIGRILNINTPFLKILIQTLLHLLKFVFFNKTQYYPGV